MPVAGVYVVRNTAEGRVFVGGSMDVDTHLRRHRLALERGRHFNPGLQLAWKAHGPDAFSFELVHQVVSPDRRDMRRHTRTWVTKLRADMPAFGYNSTRWAETLDQEAERTRPVMGERSEWAAARFGLIDR